MSSNSNGFSTVLGSIFISLGLIGGGFAVSKGIYKFKTSSNHVTVKGISERNVKSDLGIWEIDYREMGGNLSQLTQAIQTDQGKVVAFLKQHGFTDEEMEVQPFRVEDKMISIYNKTDAAAMVDQRYTITSGVRVRSSRVDLIRSTTSTASTLIQQGLQLLFDVNSVSPNPSYYYTTLDSIRPAMLSESTKSARILADQFAKDANMKIGGIITANQGLFQIMSKDTSTMSADWNSSQSALSSIDKKVRLVTTIDYNLR